MRRIVRFVVSWFLLLTGAITALTGLLADWWGLYQVRTHIWAGYAATGLGLIHLGFNLDRLLALPARARLPEWTRRSRPLLAVPRSASRRRFLQGLILGILSGVGGLILATTAWGRGLRSRNLGREYHRWSRITLRGVLWSALRWGPRPPQYKRYDGARRVPLPPPAPISRSLTTVLDERRSRRDYTGEPISLEELSALLHAAQGITEPSYPKRAAPSAGALYPLEVYVFVHRVVELAPGIYHYDVLDHALEELTPGDVRGPITRACLDQEHAHTASVVVVLSGVFARTEWKYQGRAYRYILMEAGHVGQNIYLAATGLGLGACAIGAFYDDMLDDMLGLDGEEEASLYVLTVGHPA